jgi:hypothetical protein
MGKRREEEASIAEVNWEAKQVAVTGNHHLLDAARKAAAALESVSNEFGVKITGDLTVVSFDDENVHRSAHAHVSNESTNQAQYNVSVDYNASA